MARRRILIGAGLLLAIIAALLLTGGRKAPRETALFTTLPILWAEAPDLAGLLQGDGPPHWALPVLRRGGGQVLPLDTLLRLPEGGRLLVIAQPRPLSPQENVELDRWVRAGGRVLLFADPLLTHHSAFALGDRRRPQDVVLLSPILSRWGLALRFDEAQPPGEREAEVFDEVLPVNLPGRLAATGGGGACELSGAGLAALCRIGAGRVIVLADAALLETGGDGLSDARRAVALEGLLRKVESP
ncbi:MAG: hypothetical protein RIQ46_1438 [Pseudomonadota bacterium]|jgi:hypothetical protein